MLTKLILKDAKSAGILLAACLAGGVLTNEFRATPLPLTYVPPEVRLRQGEARLGHPSNTPIPLEGDVSLSEMQKISEDHSATIIDARPEIFYRISHIPSALSLPRDDFENGYRALQSMLQMKHGAPLIVYCSGSGCEDSQLVGNSLQRLGFPHIRIFRGGWSEWDGSNLRKERNE